MEPDLERWVSGLKTLSTLIVPSMVPAVIRYALLVLALGLCIWLMARYLGGVVRQWRGRRIVDDIVVPLVFGLFALFYIGFMIVAVYMEANLPISTRYALPFYIALVIAVTLAAGSLRFSSRGSVVTWSLLGLSALVLLSNVVRTAHQSRDAYVNGIGFSSIHWDSSPILQAVKELPPNAKIYSNAPDALNFLTGRQTHYVPLRFERRTGMDNPLSPRSAQIANVAAALKQGDGYLIFADKVDWRFYLMSEDELRNALELRVIEEVEDGRIYVHAGPRCKSANSTNVGTGQP